MSLKQKNNEPNVKAPHQAVINLTCDIMERNSIGQVTGLPTKRISKIFTVYGRNFTECEENVEKFLEKLK